MRVYGDRVADLTGATVPIKAGPSATRRGSADDLTRGPQAAAAGCGPGLATPDLWGIGRAQLNSSISAGKFDGTTVT